MTDENKSPDEKKDEPKPTQQALIEIRKGEIVALCPCCKEILATTKPVDLNKEGEIGFEAKVGSTRWCKKGVLTQVPAVAAKIWRE